VTSSVLDLVAGIPAPRATDGPRVSALFLLIPAALLVVVGVWGWRNAETMSKSVPLDERTQRRRYGTYRRGAVFCLLVAVAFVVLTILSFLSVGAPR
jgi:hypothetical protein